MLGSLFKIMRRIIIWIKLLMKQVAYIFNFTKLNDKTSYFILPFFVQSVSSKES
ncbi:hypothetical protein QWZ13_11705 [Reinekea marina]|uniref:hypothetical protein n=1 Tax=Reinekea marina TaxID=1310421 RepID=UPI0025B56E97|nr:hypothetical protein [Reinekea marina]MDN3649581.1 hypothetical protein [Reinekea marina]